MTSDMTDIFPDQKGQNYFALPTGSLGRISSSSVSIKIDAYIRLSLMISDFVDENNKDE